jgi:hypothetical protein
MPGHARTSSFQNTIANFMPTPLSTLFTASPRLPTALQIPDHDYDEEEAEGKHGESSGQGRAPLLDTGLRRVELRVGGMTVSVQLRKRPVCTAELG